MKKLEKHQMLNAGLVLLFLIAVVLAFLFRDDGREVYEKGMAAYAAEDWKTATKKFEEAAEKGNPHAQFMLAQCCDSRKGMETGFSRQGEWWRKAEKTFRRRAESGDPDAMYHLGVMLYNRSPDPEEGRDWLEKAASKGNAQAKELLERIPRVETLTEAAGSDPDAMYELAEGYCNGLTGMERTHDAAELFFDAAEQGCADAVSGLRRIASYGGPYAPSLLGTLAANGNKDARRTLITLAEEDCQWADLSLIRLVRKGDTEILNKIVERAEKGSRRAVRSIYGLAAEKDNNKEAFRALVSLAEKGNKDALDDLREMAAHENEEAARALRKLADDGNPAAQQAVRDLN